MATNTTKLGLRKPGENDFYNQQTEQADNWDKVDKFADDIQNDVDATWGGMYGGYIQDVSAKVVGQRYVDKINGKAYECIKTGSDVNTTEFFRECTVKNLYSHSFTQFSEQFGFSLKIERYGKVCIITANSSTPASKSGTIFGLPEWARPINRQGGALTGDGVPVATGEFYIEESNSITFFVNNIDTVSLYTGQIVYFAKH